MSKGPKISIITACYNAEKTIEQTIKSVINQTYDNIEYIIVDGASTDGTLDIVRKYEGQIDVIISEEDKGVYDAFNRGAKLASGEYILYLNADDYIISNDVIEGVSNFIKDNNNPILLYGGVLVVNECTGQKFGVNKKVTFVEIQDGMMIPHQATFLSRNVLFEMGLFNEKYSIAADYDLLCKVYKKYNDCVVYYSKIISVFRAGGISSDFKNKEKLNKEKKDILDRHFISHKYEMKQTSNEEFLKKWIEKGLFEGKTIGNLLVIKNIKRVVLWGTGELSLILFKELSTKGIDVLFYVDNDKEKHNLEMNNIPILSPEYLKMNNIEIDCIIMSFEGRHEVSVRKQIETYNLPKELLIYSWRELVMDL
ncbi:glycosyltransferase [Lysinibacillus fusiformis]|nr:glycosyltransferase family 2 protein [Lysinibacillus fusiformis]MCK1986507.1 glycosyltransferase [Lysinibacillus fusiformis]